MAWWTGTRRTRALLVFGLVAAILLCLLGYFGLSTWRNRVADTEERIRYQARLIAAQHSNVISGTRQFVQLTAGTADLGRLLASPRCAAVLAKWFDQQHGLADLGIALPNGDVVCSAVPPVRKTNLFDRPYFQQALTNSGLVIGQAVTSRGSGKWGLPFAQSIRDDQGKLVGVLVAVADLSGLGKALAEGNDIAGSRIGLVDARGLVLARYPDQEGWTGKSIANEPLFRLLQAVHGAGTGEDIALDGVRRIFAYAPFAETADGPIHLWLGVSKDAVMAGVKRDLAWTVGGALVVLMLTFVLIVVVTSRALRTAKQTEETLRRNEQRWQFALEGAGQGVWDWDLVEQKAYYSPVLQALVGHEGVESSDTRETNYFFEWIHPDDVPKVRAEIERHLRGETALMHHEFRMRHRDGHYIWVESRGKITERDAHGRPIRVTGTNADITKTHEAQRALRISEQRWQFALEGSEQGVWDWDLVEQKAYYSPVLQAMLGWERLSANDDTSDPNFWTAWIHPDDVQQVREEIDRLLRDETQLLYNEYRMRHRDGHYIWILTRGKVTERDAQGNPIRVTGTNTDVTRAHEAARALRDSQRLYRSLGDALPMGLFRLKRGGEIQYANQYVLQMMGAASEAEVLGVNMLEFAPEPGRANAIAQHRRVIDHGVSSTLVEEHIVPGLGTVRYLEITRVPVFEEDGSISGEQGVLRDVTEQVLAQQQLRQHALVFESTHQGIVVMDADRRILAVNQAYTRITGYSEAEARGQKAEFIRSGRHGREFPQRVGSEAARSGHWEGRVWSRRKNGEIYPQFITMNALRDESGRITNFIALHMDVTESVRAEEQIRALNEALEQRVEERTRDLVAAVQELEAFSYSVSHDLRAPLRGIDGFTRIIEQKYAERMDEAGKGYLRRVRRNAARMDELIDDLLTLSRVTRSPFSSGVVDVSAAARAILADLTEANPEREVVLEVEDGVTAIGDESLLRVVLENLIGNAWKYSARRDKTEIAVGTVMTEHGKAVFVRDRGAGFDMRYADKLFVAFQRLHSSIEFEGSGIGLAIVQRVISRHGGRIWAEGAVDVGSTFYFVV